MSDDDKIIEMVEKQDTGLIATARYLVSMAFYCIIGLAVDYWLFVAAGAITAWNNPLTYMVMIFWPFVLIWQFLVIVFWIFLIVVVIFIATAIFKGIFL